MVIWNQLCFLQCVTTSTAHLTRKQQVVLLFFKKLDIHHLVKKAVHVATKCAQLSQKQFFLGIFKTKHFPHIIFHSSWFPLFRCYFIWLQIKWNSHVIKRKKRYNFADGQVINLKRSCSLGVLSSEFQPKGRRIFLYPSLMFQFLLSYTFPLLFYWFAGSRSCTTPLCW